jgi:Kef-type K+ transport system membrane component KefB
MTFANVATETTFGRFLACLAVIGLVAKLAGIIARRFGQPGVVGEILAGIALGPSLLGLFGRTLPGQLFPAIVLPHLKVAAELGLVLFMFCVGLELDPKQLRASGRHAAVISLTSIAVPFALGIGVLAPLLYRAHDQVGANHVRFAPFALFLGVSMCGTAFAVLARVLADRGLLGTRLGALLMSCAAIDDVVAFTLLGLVVAIASAGSASGVLVVLAELAALVAVLYGIVRPVLARTITRRYEANGHASAESLAVLVLGALAAAFVAQRIGLHPMMGAFVFGNSVPLDGRRRLARDLHQRLEGVSVQLLMPVFFVVTGLGVDISGLRRADVLPALLVLVVACVGKFVGGSGAAALVGIERREALAIGTLMNTRGLAELVILNVGRSVGVLDDRMYTILVVMAIVTTVMAGPLLRVVYPERLQAAQRAEAASGASPQAAESAAKSLAIAS